MTFFESLLVLLLIAVVLLQVARLLRVPYPALLAAAGVLVAFLPGTPSIAIEPETALALFIAPAVVDAAYDFPPAAALRFLAPLLALAVFAVLVTTALVAWLGHTLLGLPLAAAVALGAIVSPPDAAAATAVLGSVSVPRSAEEVLKGESLFNDATALLLFSGALALQAQGSMTLGMGVRLGLAAPGGVLLGFLWAYLLRFLNRFVRGTLGGNLLQFVSAYLAWIVADQLNVSAVLCVVTMAMVLARSPEATGFPRMRVQSFAVWSAVVFALNVFAFLIMGLQAHSIVHHMQTLPLDAALRFSAVVVLTVIVARLVVVVGFNRTVAMWARMRGQSGPPGLRQAVFVGWSGMRGFVTLATAFALPAAFPQRDTVVLTAFAVVLGTLVLQGLTLRPLIGLLGLESDDASAREITRGRAALACAALSSLQGSTGPSAENLRFVYAVDQASANQPCDSPEMRKRRQLGLTAIHAERRELEALRNRNEVGIGSYLQLQEELDWRELTLLRDEERRIEEG